MTTDVNVPAALAAPRERAFTRWDALGVTALVSLALLAAAAGLADGRRPATTFLPVFAVALVALVATVALSVAAAARESRPLREIPGALAAVWARPRGDWVVVLFGVVLALPAISLATPALTVDSDSVRLLASVLHVQREGIGYLVDTQEVLLPHAVLGVLVHLGGVPALQAFGLFSVLALAGVVAFLAWRLTGSMFPVLVSVLALTSYTAVLERTFRLPMYPAMLGFGFIGLYLAYGAVTTDERGPRLKRSLLAALCLVLSAEAHQVGQLFLVLVLLLVVVGRPGRTFLRILPIYAAVAVLALPRLVLNLWEGGLDHVLSNRVDYWVTKGYLVTIQVEFFEQPRRLSLTEYLGEMPDGLADVWGRAGLVALALGVVGLLLARPGLRRYGIVVSLFLLLVTIQLRLPFFPRYFSILLVGSALAAGVAAASLLGRYPRRRTLVGGALVVCLLAANVAGYHRIIDRFTELRAEAASDPYSVLTPEIGPGDGVIGTRSFYLLRSSTNARPFGDQFLTEEEYVTFLTWPSDEAVVELMRSRDLEWLLVPWWKARYVKRYNNTWLLPTYGKEARYPQMVAESPWFCLAAASGDAALYRLREQPAGADAPRRCRG